MFRLGDIRLVAFRVIALTFVTGGMMAGTAAVAAAAQTRVTGIHVTGAWIRPPLIPGRPGAAYFTIVNDGTTADRLVSVSSPDCQRIELHQSLMEGNVMTMKAVPFLDLTPGATITFKPGSYHAMLFGFRAPAGISATAHVTVPLILHFQTAGAITVEADIRPAGDQYMPDHGMDGMTGHMPMH